MKTFTHTFLSLLLAAAVATGCSSSNGEPQRPAEDAGPTARSVRVETLELEPTTFEDVIELTGTVEALGDARLSAQTAGTVVDLVPLGTFVQAGRTVAQLDPGQARAAVGQAEASVEAARAAFELAEDNLKRQEPLYRDSVISALEYENVRTQLSQAEAQVNQAKAALAQAEKQLANTTVTTPFTGTVEEHFAEEGEQVVPGTPVARVVSTEQVKVRAGVPERYAADITEGKPVTVSFNAYGGETRTGRISFAGAAINPQNRTFPVEVNLDNTDRRLKPEMVAKMQIARSTLDGVLVIPQAAVVRDEDGASVYIGREEGDALIAERRPVRLGPAYDGRVVVESGIEAGDLLVVLGQNTLTAGDELTVVQTYDAVGPAGLPYATDETTDVPVTP